MWGTSGNQSVSHSHTLTLTAAQDESRCCTARAKEIRSFRFVTLHLLILPDRYITTSASHAKVYIGTSVLKMCWGFSGFHNKSTHQSDWALHHRKWCSSYRSCQQQMKLSCWQLWYIIVLFVCLFFYHFIINVYWRSLASVYRLLLGDTL